MGLIREIFYTKDNTQDISLWTKVTEPNKAKSKILSGIPGGTYYVKTQLTDGKWISPYSPEVTQIVQALKLVTPTLNAPTVVSDTQIDLSWTDIENESQYELQSSTDNATWTTEATLAANTVSYTDTGLTASTTYYYRLRAIGDGTVYASSDYSAIVSAATQAADTTAPAYITGYPTTANVLDTSLDVQVQIDEPGTAYMVVLADAATAPTSAEVKAGTGSGGVAPIASGNVAVAAASTTYSIAATGLTASTAYDVYVVAQDDEATPNLQASPVLVNVTTAAATGDTTSPTISSSTLNDTNTVDITLSEGGYTNSDGTGALTAADFAIANFVAGGATALSISSVTKTDGTALVGGETVVRCVLSLTGKAYGRETFNIIPASGTAIYDAAGNAMAGTETTAQLTLHPTGYDYLTGLQIAIDDVGLATGTVNKYGTVDASGNVTKAKFIYPSAWNDGAINIKSGDTGVTLNNGIAFDGTGKMVYDEGLNVPLKTSTMHHSSGGIADFQTTHHFVTKIGNVADPNAFYGLIGSNGTASMNIGVAVFYDDRTSIPKNNALRIFVTHGNGFFIQAESGDNAINPNELSVVTVEFDGSLATADRARLLVNGVSIPLTVTGSDTQSTSNATYPLQVGAAGNDVGVFTGVMRGYTFSHAVDTATNRDNFIAWLKGKYGIA